ncbi:hypothetical protein [Leptospira santarosai]|uniref:hypothetical protein n=1 Tax=Leptospira santarosai TaxID=28183 RepID=UPI000378D1D1|nr:hypothetical protein [Leptospira santarosai]
MDQPNTLQISDLLKLVQLENPDNQISDSDGNEYDFEDLLARIPELYDFDPSHLRRLSHGDAADRNGGILGRLVEQIASGNR